MIIKCISTYPTEDQIQQLGQGFIRDRSFGVVVGREYLVLAMTIATAPGTMGVGAWVDILMEPDIPTIIPTPLCLFEIIDPRVSRYWEVRDSAQGAIRLWPSSFYADYYHDDLSERLPSVVEDFWRVYRQLVEESKTLSLKDEPWSN